jgi:hypothetical protein
MQDLNVANVSVLADILSVLAAHWRIIVGILLVMFLSQILVWSVLKLIFRDRLDSEEYVSLAAAGWILPLSLASLLWLAWGTIQRSTFSALVMFSLVGVLAIVLFLRARNDSTRGSKAFILILSLLFVVFLFLRLAFVSEVIMPLYFDSAQHYLTTKNLFRSITSTEVPSFTWPTTSYYHIGFQLLTAMMASSLRADIINTMLILGQVILAATSFPLFSMIKRETQSSSAGLFAVLLAAFGWYMPAYAVNWGKYPALSSLPLITFTISLAYLSIRQKQFLSPRKHLLLNVILILGILVTILAHSRSLIVFGIIALAWLIATGWQMLSKPLRIVSFLAILAALVWIILYIRTKDVFGLLFDPYWEKGMVVSAGVLFLAAFAQWRYPRLAFASVLVILLLLGSLLIVVQIPGYGLLTLLDRPFVEMFLYLPLSILGGAGLAGLERSLQPLTPRWQVNRFWSGYYLSGLFIALLTANAIINYNLYPTGCCSVIGRDDLVAIDWMDKNLPPDARIIISSTELHVLPTDAPQGSAGSDAGTWITSLTDRVTLPLPYQSDFSQQTVFDTICRWKADYLYVGEIGAMFNDGQISPFPDRYRILLSMPTAKVYQVIGCP